MSATNYTTATEVATELTRRIETIRTAAGFSTEAGQRVHRGKLNVTSDDVPCVSIVEGDDHIDNSPSKRQAVAHIRQDYAAVIYVPCDPKHPNDAAHLAIRDLKRAIFKDGDATWGGKVRSVTYKGRNIAPRADGVAIVQAIVEIVVEYAEDLSA